ncbi:MAG: GAF domain-containing protein [Desulfobacterales bacterium]|jgi:K+-sensing histidine kinase KdpD
MEPSDNGHPKRRRSVRRKDERELRNQISRYNRLFHIGQLLTSEMGFDHLFEVIVDQTKEVMASERCSVFLIDEQELNLTAFVSTDLKRNEIVLPKTEGVAGWVFQNKIPLIVPDAYADSRFCRGIDGQTGFQTRNILCVPLINRKNKCIGTLQALNKKSGDYSPDDKEIMLHLANYVTIALENSRLYEKLKASDKAKQKVISHLSHELKTPLAILETVLELIERKSTAAHDRSLDKMVARGKRNVSRLNQLQEKVDDIIRERAVEEKAAIVHIIEDALSLVEELDDSTAGQCAAVVQSMRDRIESIFKIKDIRIENIPLDDFLSDILNRKLPSNNRDYPEIRAEIEKGLSVSMDRAVLEKGIVGLLKNAVENTPDEGLITVSAQSVDDQICIEVHDDGIGITDEQRNYIFGGFLPAQQTEWYASKKPYDFNAGGVGLDLLRIKLFSERFGFQVGFESTRCKYIPKAADLCPGKISDCPHVSDRAGCLRSGGSTFRLTFPKIS